MESKPLSRAPSAAGGLVRIQIRLADYTTWLTPAWAALCGAVASAHLRFQASDLLVLAFLMVLVDAGWGTMWWAAATTNWRSLLARWRADRQAETGHGWAGRRLPYTQIDSPGERATQTLAHLQVWGRDVLWPAAGPALGGGVVALLLTALVATVLGFPVLLLSIAVLALIQLGVAWTAGSGEVSPGWNALLVVLLPWLAGHLAFGPINAASLFVATMLTVAWAAVHDPLSFLQRLVWIASQVAVVGVAAVAHSPLWAALLLLLLAPQVTLVPWLRRGRPAAWFVQHARPWLMAALLVAALSVA